MTFKKYHVSKQNLPSRERYGWELNGTSLDPIMTDNPQHLWHSLN